MTLEDCTKCKYHELYRDGYAICTYLKFRDQRVTRTEPNGVVVLVECPLEKN